MKAETELHQGIVAERRLLKDLHKDLQHFYDDPEVLQEVNEDIDRTYHRLAGLKKRLELIKSLGA